MSGFDRNWLALREPVDARSRDATLMAAAVETIENMSHNIVLDMGCGTGSLYRALSPKIERKVSWRLVDDDEALLDEARRRHGSTVELMQGDLNNLEALPLEDVGLVTASALFDLCSEQFICRLVERISASGAGLYAALNYDGGMHWSKPHPLDDAVTTSFNAHQQGDKGFGPALGPNAWDVLAAHLRTQGYSVRVAASPWTVAAADAALQQLFLEGLIRAVYEQGHFDESEIRDWAGFRRRMIGVEGSLCRIGHQDILAFR